MLQRKIDCYAKKRNRKSVENKNCFFLVEKQVKCGEGKCTKNDDGWISFKRRNPGPDTIQKKKRKTSDTQTFINSKNKISFKPFFHKKMKIFMFL